MSTNKWVRQAHRWLAITFTVTIIVVVIALSTSAAVWVSYVPLLPLALLLFTGLYLFTLPFQAKRRRARRTAEQD